MQLRKSAGKTAVCAALVAVTLSLGACTAQYRNHGYVPPADDLAKVVVGKDTRDSVAEKVGVPSAAGLLDDSGFYYVRSRKRSIGMFEPKEIERQVVAISFSPSGVVQNVERFGLERGRVVRLERRVTSSSTSNKTLIRQLLGNLGRFNPAGLGG